QRGLQFIAIASATAPLLGLLGTVTGMIHTFDLIRVFGTGDARSLAHGISEALVTTEFGLIVAIPALILHALLSRKIKSILGSMEMASLAFVNGLQTKEKAA
ncbi:MAG: MotA/TolQ/ExbB proton channel family protein, partial [Verrucomicrobiota bacterium]